MNLAEAMRCGEVVLKPTGKSCYNGVNFVIIKGADLLSDILTSKHCLSKHYRAFQNSDNVTCIYLNDDCGIITVWHEDFDTGTLPYLYFLCKEYLKKP